jgi:hypothetical protein
MATAEQKKRAERYYVEHVQQHYPGHLPASAPKESEEPDFLFDTADGVVGVEVMQLFHTAEPGMFPELQVAQFHRDVVVRAGEVYAARKLGPPVDVTTYYRRDVALTGLQQCAEALAEFVAASPYGTTSRSMTSPKGLSVMSKQKSRDSSAQKWQCFGNSHTPLLTHEFLSAVIAKKNALLARYRRKAPASWLLLVSTLGSLESTFAAPRDLPEWQFAFDFDRVLLLVQEPGGPRPEAGASMEAGGHSALRAVRQAGSGGHRDGAGTGIQPVLRASPAARGIAAATDGVPCRKGSRDRRPNRRHVGPA